MVFVRKRKDESLLREDASAVAIRAMADETKAGHRGAKETCHSAKRTHFILGVLIGGPDAAETKTNPSPPSSFALSADKTAGRLASTEGRLMTGQTRCVFYHGRGVGAPPCEERSYETYRY